MTSAQMKDSGIAWIGQVPSDWDIHRVKYHFQHDKHVVGIHSSKYERLALTMQGVIKRSKEDNEGLQPEDFASYQILRQNELVFKLIDLQNISTSRVGLSPYEGLVSPAYIILHASSASCPKYAYYFFLFMWLDAIFNSLGDAGVRSSLNAGDLLNLPLVVPPLPEQQRMADYLDKKCAEIDTLSQNIQKQIDTLEQYKRAVITETVTKGLNPSAPMKDSGIPWIGQIPQHWNTIKVKFLASFYNGYAFDSESLTDEGDTTVIRIGDICEGSIKPETALKYNGPTLTLKPYQIEKEDILIALSGATVGKTGYITKDYPNTFINQRVGIIRSTNSRFLNYALQTSSFIPFALLHAAASAQPNISLDTIGNYTIAFPNNSGEQQQIVDCLDDKCGKIDAIIQGKQQQLEKLEQYKKATIFEYVTGKKQVPEV